MLLLKLYIYNTRKYGFLNEISKIKNLEIRIAVIIGINVKKTKYLKILSQTNKKKSTFYEPGEGSRVG